MLYPSRHTGKLKPLYPDWLRDETKFLTAKPQFFKVDQLINSLLNRKKNDLLSKRSGADILGFVKKE